MGLYALVQHVRTEASVEKAPMLVIFACLERARVPELVVTIVQLEPMLRVVERSARVRSANRAVVVVMVPPNVVSVQPGFSRAKMRVARARVVLLVPSVVGTGHTCVILVRWEHTVTTLSAPSA